MAYDQKPTYRGDTDQLQPNDWRVLRLQQNVPTTLDLDYTDDPRLDNVDQYEPTDPSGLMDVVKLYITEKIGGTICFALDATRVTVNTFTVEVPLEAVVAPGLYFADLQIYHADQTTPEQGTLKYSRQLYLEIAQNSTSNGSYGDRLTIAQVRRGLEDYETVNYLIDDYEFSDKEIFEALIDVVDMWNETPPAIATQKYNTFPYRNQWRDAAIGILLSKTSRRKLRDHANVQGAEFDDTSKWQHYYQLGMQLRQEYQHFIKRTKHQTNVNSAFRGFI